MALSKVQTSVITDDAVTGAKIENNPTIAGNLTTAGTFTSRGIDDNADATAINITSGENVGIGVVPETTWNSNIDALQLGLGASIYGDNTATGLQISANAVATLGSSLNGYKYIGSDKASTYQQYDGEHNFRVASSGSADGAITWSTAMTINNTGAVTKPLQPAFHVHKNGTNVTNIPTGDSTLTWAAERFDQNSDFDLANNRFTAPVTGKYFLQLHVRLMELDISANYIFLSINTSNKEYNFIIDPDFGDSDPAYYSIGFSVLADMDANDTVNVLYSQLGGAAQIDIDGRNNYTWFSGYLVA
tara:strand:- start:98 stop:1006 length:909 start_codon:yes stop_codon:yes gene_type:complete